jgi:hypothetical protein
VRATFAVDSDDRVDAASSAAQPSDSMRAAAPQAHARDDADAGIEKVTGWLAAVGSLDGSLDGLSTLMERLDGVWRKSRGSARARSGDGVGGCARGPSPDLV